MLDARHWAGPSDDDRTNPAQFFATDYSTCLLGALKYIALQKKVKLSEETSVAASIGIGSRDDGKGFGLEKSLTVAIPGMERTEAKALVAQADIVYPYSYLAHNGATVGLSIAGSAFEIHAAGTWPAAAGLQVPLPSDAPSCT